MHHLSMTEIADSGEKHMENWLVKNGFKNVKIHRGQGSLPEIEADGSMENILVHVKTVLTPGQHDKLNDEEKTKFIIRAARLERVGYLAYVVIDNDKNLSGEIAWEKLRLLD